MKQGDKKRHLAKADLPQKICASCNRPFTWRKKWERDWENLRYCSDACRKKRKSSVENP